jgi:hypothetical protein
VKTHDVKLPTMSTHGNDHERTDAHVAPLVTFVIGMAITCALAFWAMKALLEWAKEEPVVMPGNQVHPLAEKQVIPPEPRLEVMKTLEGGSLVRSEDWKDGSAMFTSQSKAALEARARAHLGSYGWIDQQAGITHIPIARAKELVLQGGLPVAEKK